MVIVLMGVSGSGKTRIGRLLSEDLGWPFYDGDEFQPPENIQKMSSGIPLTDEDRIPWLNTLRMMIIDHLEEGKNAILASSALKQSYRDMLLIGKEDVHFVFLKGGFDLIQKRMKNRQHFMKPGMLASQFETLEEPAGVLLVDISQTPATIVDQIKKELGLTSARPSARRAKRRSL